MHILPPQRQEKSLIRVRDPEMRSPRAVTHCGLVSNDLFAYIYYVESIILYFFWLYSMLQAVLLISRFSHYRGFLGILFHLLFLDGFVFADIPFPIPKSHFQLA